MLNEIGTKKQGANDSAAVLVPSIKKMRSFVKLGTVLKYKMYASVCGVLKHKKRRYYRKAKFRNNI